MIVQVLRKQGSMTLSELDAALARHVSEVPQISLRQLRTVVDDLVSSDQVIDGARVERDGRFYSVSVAGEGTLSPVAATLLWMGLNAVSQAFGSSVLREHQHEFEALLPAFMHVLFQRNDRDLSIPRQDLQLLLTAWVRNERVCFYYRKNMESQSQERRHVRISSVMISDRNAQAYLVGFRELPDGTLKEGTYRLDRISRVQRELPKGVPDARIPIRDLAQDLPKTRVALEFDLAVYPDIAQRLSEERVRDLELGQLDGNLLSCVLKTPVLPDGRPTFDASWLLGWGKGVRVVGPEPVRQWFNSSSC